MSWFPRLKATQEPEENPIMYLSPEAMRHVYIMSVEDFEEFQNSPEFIPGGRLMEVYRQYSYTLRKVADLREEALSVTDDWRIGEQKKDKGPSLEEEDEFSANQFESMDR